MIHLYIILAVLVATVIEWRRIKAVKGRWFNVPKWVTVMIAISLNAIVFWICGIDDWYFIIGEMIFVRGAIYDPLLNRLRGLKWDYVSQSTNSWLDQLERKIGLHFAAQRILYGLLALLFIILTYVN